MSFDMNQCKKGDKLICRDGIVVEYEKLIGGFMYPHKVKYESGHYGTRTDTGLFYLIEGDNKDIIGFYKEEKDMNTFDIGNLKTGQRITLENGRKYTVLTNVDCTRYKRDTVTVHYNDPTYGKGWDCIKDIGSTIVKVEAPDNIQSVLFAVSGNASGSTVSYTTVWEKPAPLTPEQIKQQELQAKYDAAKKELEELGKALGVNK